MLWESRSDHRTRISIQQYSWTIAAIFGLNSIVILFHPSLSPREFWVLAKLGTSILALGVACLARLRPALRLGLLKALHLGASLYLTYFQAHSIDFRPQTPFFYVPLFAGFSALVLNENLPLTLFAYLGLLLAGIFGIAPGRVELLHELSVSSVTLFLLTYLRIKAGDEVRIFILEQKAIDDQKALIEAQTQLSEQIGTFLPREIYQRVIRDMARGNAPLEAVENHLRPKEVPGAVLFTDIRGFTRMTKLGTTALLNSVIPAQKACTDIIEDHHGIPRLQGDLVFAYFDSLKAHENILRALSAAIEIDLETREMNAESEGPEVQRFMILSLGRVWVGNLGGTSGSRDITVLGNAANLPSRIDAVTKLEPLASALKESHLILTEEAIRAIPTPVLNSLDCKPFDLHEAGIMLRDFETETRLFLLKADHTSLTIVKKFLNTPESLFENQFEEGVAQ